MIECDTSPTDAKHYKIRNKIQKRRKFAAFCLIGILALSNLVLSSVKVKAQTPELGGLVPAGGPRGQTTLIHVEGKNLAGAHLYLSGSGIAIKSQQVAASGNQITAEVTVETNARLGPHDIRIATPKGISGGARFWVDVLPNRVLDQPMSEAMPPVELNGKGSEVINGRIAARSGRDRFALTVAAGDVWSFDCYADRIRSRFDPVLELRDEAGVSQRLVQSTWESDPRFSYRFAKAGRYSLTVRDSEYNGGPNFTYRLQAGRVPFVAGYLPRGGQPGQTIPLRLQGLGLASLPVPTAIPLDITTDTYWAEVPTAAGMSSLLPLLVESEPVLDAGDGAGVRALPGFPLAVDGVFMRSSHAKFSFHGAVKAHYLFDLLGRRIGSRIDGIIRVLDAAGKEIAANDDAPNLGKDARLDFAPPTEGEYSIEVSNVEDVTGPDCYYRLKMSLVQPDFNVSINTDKLSVPRGNTIELPVRLERLGGYAGPVLVRLENLPAGLQAQGGIIAAGKNEVQVTLTALPNAEYTGSGIRIIGEAAIGGKAVVHDAPGWERYEHRSIDLVLSVEFNYTRPHHLWDLLLAAVTERAAPITVTTSMADVQLAPGKSVEIPIHVTREANAKNEIKLEIRNLPAKVTATLASIPANQTEGKLVLTAAADAAPDITNIILQAKHDNAVTLAPAIHLSVKKP